jgi:8-oxo-dGTP pyrophosphatase MutT (NUDIX family)
MRELPPFPPIDIHVVADVTEGSSCSEGFIRVRRRRLALTLPDGSRTEDFAYDEASRRLIDAVAVVVHYVDAAGQRMILLRSAVRPPLFLRPKDTWPIPEERAFGHLWEIPAGLVETAESNEEGLRICAARELEEETGLELTAADIQPLGGGAFPTPGLIAEKIFFFHCEIQAGPRPEPKGDGPLEQGARIVDLPLAEAMAMARASVFEDMKTELAIRRLFDLYPC